VSSPELRRAARLTLGLLASLGLLLGTAACRRQAARPSTRSLRGASRPAPLNVEMPPVVNHACELLTKDDAEEVLGGPLQPPVTSITRDIGVVSSRCGYIAKGATPAKVVTLLAKTWQDPAAAKRAFEHAHALSQTVSGQAPVTIAGLGNRAYWAGGTVGELNVLAGATWMAFSGTAGPGLDSLPQDQAAARKALAHQSP
jgi:hypothetical protein